MKRTLFAIAFFATTLTAAVQSPSQFLGFEVGADRKLADYKQIVSYFRALAAASPRVRVETLGKTTLGEDFIMAIVTAEGNMRNLQKIREAARRLADPRGLDDEQIAQLARDGKGDRPRHLQHPLVRDRVEPDGDGVGSCARDREPMLRPSDASTTSSSCSCRLSIPMARA
ncbi:MAG TPA: hypothetical protein VGQ21_05955 [Thermoanaerobaculia bacterium]|jgi:hypothetical protein|nr:hypothetical protein [Thermoanaerobaculia bacterium]